MGGHLATIETVEENIFVFRTFSEYDNVERNLWIGLNDFLIEGLFLWSSGTISEYENFAPGEPTNLFDEDFVHIWYPSVINPDGCWNNAPDIINISNRPCHGVVELPFLLGDVNQDGAVDLLDVEPFVELLSSEKFLLEADINKDGIVDLLDVGPFVDLLLNS